MMRVAVYEPFTDTDPTLLSKVALVALVEVQVTTADPSYETMFGLILRTQVGATGVGGTYTVCTEPEHVREPPGPDTVSV